MLEVAGGIILSSVFWVMVLFSAAVVEHYADRYHERAMARRIDRLLQGD